MSQRPHLVIIDGLSFLFRAYHAVRPLTREDGLPTNALYGFAQMLIRVVRDLQPDYCCVALDSIGPTFRKDMYPEYKAHRGEMDEPMKQQMPYFEPMISAFGLPGIRVEGVEADDIIATLANTHRDEMKITIVSSDKDLMQLLDENVQLLDTMKNRRIGPAEVEEKFGVGPANVIDVQALIGDSSDNIPGVKGIGPKTAAQLIQQFGSFDTLYASLEQVEKERLRVSLTENQALADISRTLVTLKQDVDLTDCQVSKDSLQFDPDFSNATDFLNSLEFYSLAKRLQNDKGGQPKSVNIDRQEKSAPQSQAAPTAMQGEQVSGQVDRSQYVCLTNKDSFEDWLKQAEACDVIAIDTETTSLNAMQAELVGISLAVAPGKAAYVPLTYQPQLSLESTLEAVEILDKDYVFTQLTPLLSKPSLTKIGHNIKYDLIVLANAGLAVTNIADTMVQSFVLNGGKHVHNMDELSNRYLNHQPITYKEVCGTGKNQLRFDEVSLDQATTYAAEDADITLQLYRLFSEQLAADDKTELLSLYNKVEVPLIPVLTAMERAGIQIDQAQLKTISAEFSKQITSLEERIHLLTEEPFNVNSPAQLGQILFEKLGLKVNGKTPKSTNVTVMEKLAADESQPLGQELAGLVLEYRQLSKLRSTYSEALQQQINPRTGRVHTSYNQTGAATGRFSSSDPNLQNIPIRTENGRRIRRAFIAAEGCELLAADYSQIELRLLAHFSGNAALTEAFATGQDIHRFTASKLFNKTIDEVESDERRIAKTINFGLIYGMGPVALARNIGISRTEAGEFIERYFARFEGLKDYLESLKEQAREYGYVTSLMGRRIHLPDIHSSQPMFRAGAERAAVNAPLQGSNADIIKQAMPEVYAALAKANLGGKILLQVHDELVLEVPTDELEQTAKLVKTTMEQTVQLKVPLLVETGCAKDWESAH